MPVKRVKKSNWRQSEVLWGYIFILPVILGLLLFYFGPMLFSLLISFMNWDMITPMTFAGLDNYSRMISDPLVVDSVKATALYTLLTVPSAVTASFLTAMLLNSKAKGRAFFRIVFYIPSIVPAVVSAALWIYLFDPMFGPINLLSKAIGIGQIGFIYTKSGVIPSFTLMTVWASGNMVIIFLAGLQSVPAQLYEAAELDGARFFRRLFHITIPMCSPILFYNIVICVINSLQSFTQAYIMTKGGPNNASLFYVLLLYRAAFTNQAMGYSSAMSWVFFIAIAVLSLISFKVSNLWVFYENDGA